jgi:hypothetical protein
MSDEFDYLPVNAQKVQACLWNPTDEDKIMDMFTMLRRHEISFELKAPEKWIVQLLVTEYTSDFQHPVSPNEYVVIDGSDISIKSSEQFKNEFRKA